VCLTDRGRDVVSYVKSFSTTCSLLTRNSLLWTTCHIEFFLSPPHTHSLLYNTSGLLVHSAALPTFPISTTAVQLALVDVDEMMLRFIAQGLSIYKCAQLDFGAPGQTIKIPRASGSGRTTIFIALSVRARSTGNLVAAAALQLSAGGGRWYGPSTLESKYVPAPPFVAWVIILIFFVGKRWRAYVRHKSHHAQVSRT
jgi:hypothetical protein